MKKERDITYYRSILHNDSIALLIFSIISIILNFIFIGQGEKVAVPLALNSIILTVFSIILICNKKKIKKFVGVITMIMSFLMIFSLIISSSLFGMMYFLFGIFLFVHSISYLREFKKYNI